MQRDGGGVFPNPITPFPPPFIPSPSPSWQEQRDPAHNFPQLPGRRIPAFSKGVSVNYHYIRQRNQQRLTLCCSPGGKPTTTTTDLTMGIVKAGPGCARMGVCERWVYSYTRIHACEEAIVRPWVQRTRGDRATSTLRLTRGSPASRRTIPGIPAPISRGNEVEEQHRRKGCGAPPVPGGGVRGRAGRWNRRFLHPAWGEHPPGAAPALGASIPGAWGWG